MTFPDPFTLLGTASTAFPGTSVALYQNYAYKSGTGGIESSTSPTRPIPS